MQCFPCVQVDRGWEELRAYVYCANVSTRTKTRLASRSMRVQPLSSSCAVMVREPPHSVSRARAFSVRDSANIVGPPTPTFGRPNTHALFAVSRRFVSCYAGSAGALHLRTRHRCSDAVGVTPRSSPLVSRSRPTQFPTKPFPNSPKCKDTIRHNASR
jgi:hypothetical protein